VQPRRNKLGTEREQEAAQIAFERSPKRTDWFSERILNISFRHAQRFLPGSFSGAHLLLQTRTKLLNNELEDVFRRWYPRFRIEGREGRLTPDFLVNSGFTAKKALRRVKKISTAFIFEATVSREAAERKLVDDLLGLFGGRSRPIIAHLIESGTFTLEDVREAEKILLEHERKDEAK
jgi:hypothetical protein